MASSGNQKRKTPTDDYFYFEESEEGEIMVKTDTGKIISLKVNGLDTIGSVKLKIYYKEDIPFDQQELLFNGKLIDNTNTLANLPITKHTPTLTLMRKSAELMEIYVNCCHTGKTISLMVKPTYTIKEVKLEIQRQEGIDYKEQELILNNMILGDMITLFEFNVIRKSTLTLMRRSTGFVGFMRVFIKALDGDQIVAQEVEPSDTIFKLKNMIQNKVDIPITEFELIFNEMVLRDCDTLANCNINTESTLTLMRISTGFMHIFIKTNCGNTITLNVKPSYTIYNVKLMIESEESCPPHRQRLNFAGKELKDSPTLADYHVPKESTLEVFFLIGGRPR